MQTTTNYRKAMQFERLMCRTFNIPSNQGKKLEVTHAYQTLLYALESKRIDKRKLNDQFQRVIGLLVQAIIVFRKRNQDETIDAKLLWITCVLFQPLTETEIAWAIEELGSLMSI